MSQCCGIQAPVSMLQRAYEGACSRPLRLLSAPHDYLRVLHGVRWIAAYHAVSAAMHDMLAEHCSAHHRAHLTCSCTLLSYMFMSQETTQCYAKPAGCHITVRESAAKQASTSAMRQDTCLQPKHTRATHRPAASLECWARRLAGARPDTLSCHRPPWCPGRMRPAAGVPHAVPEAHAQDLCVRSAWLSHAHQSEPKLLCHCKASPSTLAWP